MDYLIILKLKTIISIFAHILHSNNDCNKNSKNSNKQSLFDFIHIYFAEDEYDGFSLEALIEQVY